MAVVHRCRPAVRRRRARSRAGAVRILAGLDAPAISRTQATVRCRRIRAFSLHWAAGWGTTRERPKVAIPRHTDDVHLTVSSRAQPFGDAPRPGVLRKNSRDRVRPSQYVARIVPNASRCFGRKTLTPDGGVEGVAKLALVSQRDPTRRFLPPKPASANPVFGCHGFDNEVHYAAAPDQGAVFLAQNREIAEREPLIARECVPQECGRLFGRAGPASGIEIPRDFRKCMNASEERQIVQNHPPQHEASRLQLVCAVRQGHLQDVSAVSGRHYNRAARTRQSPNVERGAPDSKRPSGSGSVTTCLYQPD